MAGYIINLDSSSALEYCVKWGVYATKFNKPRSHIWDRGHEGTFADYATMKEGDNIYFFIDRKIYGVGQLINIGVDCKYFNFPGAGDPAKFNYRESREQLLLGDEKKNINQRVVCLFKPNPYMFKTGVDMDDVLLSNPDAFKMLRAFWKLSFIKIGGEENQALKNVLLKFNERSLENGLNSFEFDAGYHASVIRKLTVEHQFKATQLLNMCDMDGVLRHEMAIELGLLLQLSMKEAETTSLFGSWDYLSHQVVASPFKPIDYMDKMDIFGYRFITGYEPTISKFLVIELKKDKAKSEDLIQLMKYVDWIKNEYCYGDYSMIDAFLVAKDYDDAIIEQKKSVANRQYVIGMKPPKSEIWSNLNLIKYRFDKTEEKILFTTYTPGA